MYPKEKNLSLIIVADVGGSHITSGVYNVQENTLLQNSIVRNEVDSAAPCENILKTFTTTLAEVASKTNIEVQALALAMPGPFDYEKGISYIKGLKKYDSLYGVDMKRYFSNFFGICEELVIFRNDAECTIAGEVMGAEATTEECTLGITLGTGFGSAISREGVTRDANFGAESFQNGIADEYFSTRWFTLRFWELTGINVINVKGLFLEKDLDLVRKIFLEFADSLADFLEPRIEEEKISTLIICGNIAKAYQLFMPQLSKRLSKIDIRLGKLGEHAAMIGAAEHFCQSPVNEKPNQF